MKLYLCFTVVVYSAVYLSTPVNAQDGGGITGFVRSTIDRGARAVIKFNEDLGKPNEGYGQHYPPPETQFAPTPYGHRQSPDQRSQRAEYPPSRYTNHGGGYPPENPNQGAYYSHGGYPPENPNQGAYYSHNGGHPPDTRQNHDGRGHGNEYSRQQQENRPAASPQNHGYNGYSEETPLLHPQGRHRSRIPFRKADLEEVWGVPDDQLSFRERRRLEKIRENIHNPRRSWLKFWWPRSFDVLKGANIQLKDWTWVEMLRYPRAYHRISKYGWGRYWKPHSLPQPPPQQHQQQQYGPRY